MAIFLGFGLIFANVEINAAIALVGEAGIDDFLDNLNLLDDVAAGVGLDAGWQHVEASHGLVVAVGVVLRHLHGLQLLEASLLGYLVLALVGVVLQVPHIGDVAHVAHLVALVTQVAEQYIEGYGGTSMPQVRVAIYGGATDVHAHVVGSLGSEKFLGMGKRIID